MSCCIQGWVNCHIALYGGLFQTMLNVTSNVATIPCEDVYTYMWNSEILDRGLPLPDVH